MKNNSFEKGQYVVYPAHGVGIINGIEEQEISGIKLKVIVICFEKDKMTLRLPLNKNTTQKIRKLCSQEELKQAIEYLKIPTKTKKMMWSRRAQEYENKINSGDIMSITEVVRDLYRNDTQSEHSYSERQIFQEAIDRLTREYAAVAKINPSEAMKNIEMVLAA